MPKWNGYQKGSKGRAAGTSPSAARAITGRSKMDTMLWTAAWLLTIFGAFRFGRFTKSYPPPEEMLRRLVVGHKDKTLLEMTKKLLQSELQRVNRSLAQE